MLGGSTDGAATTKRLALEEIHADKKRTQNGNKNWPIQNTCSPFDGYTSKSENLYPKQNKTCSLLANLTETHEASLGQSKSSFLKR